MMPVLTFLSSADMEQAGPIVTLTLTVCSLAVLISAFVGIPAGACLGMLRSRRRRRQIAVVVHTGMALPPVVVGLVLYLVLSRSGPLAELGWLFTPRAMVAAQIVLALPFVVGITATSVASVPAELTEQLVTLGVGPWMRRRAILREARQGVLLAVAAAFGRSISEVGAVLIVGGNIAGQTRVLTTAIVLETGKGNFSFALLLGGVLLGLAVLVNLIILSTLASRPAA